MGIVFWLFLSLRPFLFWLVNRNHCQPSFFFLFYRGKKNPLLILTCTPRNSPSHSCIITPFTYQSLYPIFTLKAPYCIYIYYDHTRFFFTVNVFVPHPILFSRFSVALMWNVCAEPIECCVYIKATLFLTSPVFLVSGVWCYPRVKNKLQDPCPVSSEQRCSPEAWAGTDKEDT